MKKKIIWPALLAGMMLAGAVGGASGNIELPDLGRLDRFIADYPTESEYITKGHELNIKIGEEGMVLLKNKDNTLPFKDVQKISVFGKASTSLQYGGGGSGAGSGNIEYNLQKSLTEAGYELNPELTKFYGDEKASGRGRRSGNSGWKGISQATVGETPLSAYPEGIEATYEEYKDAAIMVIARGGEEGADCKTIDGRDFDGQDSTFPADPYTTDHILKLSKNEAALLDMIETKFNKVIILINSGNIFQCDRFEKDDKVSGVIWMGTPGSAGAAAVGRILNGTVNPSGHTVDTWTRDFTQDPSFQNFADNSQTNIIDGKGYANDTMLRADGSPMNSSATARWEDEAHHVVAGALNGVKPAQYVSYEEGIYVDYRYYETRYADLEAKEKGAGDKWYAGNEGVIYPFGYGLSYTTFEQKIVDSDVKDGATINGNRRRMNISVKVKNTGNVAGKDVVQVYFKAPYEKGKIEKAYEVLCAFDKTKVLEPGEEQTLKLSFYLQDVASYDFADKNGNGFKGYELDGGEYRLSINKDAHRMYEEFKFNIPEGGFKYEKDRYTGVKVENHFSDNDFFSTLPLENDIEFTQMTRADFGEAKVNSFPSHPTLDSRKVKEGSRVEEFLTHEFRIEDLDIKHNGYVSEEAYKDKAFFEEKGWTQQKTALSKDNRRMLAAMKNIPLDDPEWDVYLNEFTYKELQTFVEDGAFHNPGLSSIDKPSSTDSDGPSQFNKIWWFGAPIVAATWNVELARAQGEMVGTEAHFAAGGWGWGGGGSSVTGKYGWFGPAVNTHRSPFGGRNFEYYAADPFLMGRIAANVVGAATDKGVYCYFKHFAVNDQEKGREGTSTFLTEQALREIYLKSFQMVFQEGKSRGVMSSYNRIGNMETAASYPLLTKVLREEWGFKGSVLSDMDHHGNSSFNHKCYENINNRALSGCNAQLENANYANEIECVWSNDAFDGKGAPTFKYTDENGQTQTGESYSWWYAVRKLAKEELWMYVNCGAMDTTLVQRVKDALTIQGLDDRRTLNLKAGEEVNIPVTLNANLEGYNVSVDPRHPLPAGLAYENGALKGKVEKDGETYVVFLIEKDNDIRGYDFYIDVRFEEAVDEKQGGGEGGKQGGGCFGSIATASIAATMIAAAAGLILLKKKKED